ncbi:MAG: N-acylglucosamine 2-epimerase, partial [Bacteroidetes bacterium]|nr:N-acylglucosamine 2-epimerase [Bacteroidota bacterium]
DYVKNSLLDYDHGDWFEGGLDKEPHFKTGPKGHIWKCNYHTGRAMMNCIKMLADDEFQPMKENRGFRETKEETDKFIAHWQKTAEKIG